MKTYLPLVALCAMLLFACSKAEDPQPETVNARVSFNVSEFNSEIKPVGKTGNSVSALGDTLRNHADYLYAHIFYAGGTDRPAVHIEQTSATPSFGNVSASLAPGNYLAVFVASKLPTAFSGSHRYTSMSMQPGMDDVFISHRQFFTVGARDTTQSIRLVRWTGAVELNLEDSIPSNVTKISIETPNNASGYVWDVGQYPGADRTFSIKEFIVAAADRGRLDTRYLMHILNPGHGMTFVIKAYNSSNVVVAQKTVSMVNIVRNRRTVLRGRLFSATTTFFVTVDPAWLPSDTPVPF